MTCDEDDLRAPLGACSLAMLVRVMRDGNIEQVGTPVKIYSRPATRFVASLVGTANLIPARVRDKEAEGVALRIGEYV